jgi:DNA-binding LacI/PurR family transcriptional regulator
VKDYSQQDGANSMNELLDRKPRVEAVFCAAGDTTAAGMLEAARARAVRIPEDIAVLSCDDLFLAASTDPPLSSIRQPLDAIAREAHRLVVEERAEILARPRHVLFPPTLIRRQSA